MTIDPIHNSKRHQLARRYPLRRVVSTMLFQGKGQVFGHGSNEYVLECGHRATSRGCNQRRSCRCRECWKNAQRLAKYYAQKTGTDLQTAQKKIYEL